MSADILNQGPKWQTLEHPVGHRENEPTQEEFFSHADIVSEVASLVRESIQNSLDERLDENAPIRMVFVLGEQNKTGNNFYFADLLPHIQTVKEIETPDLNTKSKYLVIEDFNTLGLEGGVSAVARTDEHLEKIEREKESSKESFYFFQWKSGGSNKKSGSKGSWGVGKVVYPRASSAKSYFVYSVRRPFPGADAGPELLFGQSILNYRWVNGKRYVPDCQWMVRDESRFNHSIPSESRKDIDKFLQDWTISRKPNQTGTSIVIPFCKEELTTDKLIQSICRDYFINILSGVLECKVIDVDGKSVDLNKSNLVQVIKTLDEDMTTRSSKSGTELVKLCEMFESTLKGEAIKFVLDFGMEDLNNWYINKVVQEDQRESMEKALESSAILDVQVHTWIPENIDPRKGKISPAQDTFRVILQRTHTGNASTVFCREGILIPDANNNSKLQDILSLVLVGDVAGTFNIENSLANLLKWSEGPSHETWSAGATKFVQRYRPKKAGEEVIRWVKNAASRIVELIRNEEETSDDKSLSDYAPDDDDDGIRTDIEVPNEPRVFLGVSRASTPSMETQLVWRVENFDQSDFVVNQLLPIEKVLGRGLKETKYELIGLDIAETYSYQVTISDGKRNLTSNKVFVRPTIKLLDPIAIHKQANGFKILPISVVKTPVGQVIEVRSAYPTRNDSSVNSWSELDFILNSKFETNSSRGVEILDSGVEKMLLKIIDADFEATWTGFDPLRDLTVQTRIVEVLM